MVARSVVLVALLMSPSCVNAGFISYDFSGVLLSSNPIINASDTFTGSYTFDTAVTPGTHPDSTLDDQAAAIHSSLPGTSWTLNVNSTAIAPFSISGDFGVIAIGNNTTFGDRYSTTLSNSSPIALPLGGTLNFFQIDMQDPIGAGADMLSSGSYTTLPDLLLANSAGGRFFTSDYGSGCTQCGLQILSLALPATVPEPSTLTLAALGLLSLGMRRRGRRIHDKNSNQFTKNERKRK